MQSPMKRNSTKTAAILLFYFSTVACTTHLTAQESPYADGFPTPVPSSKAPPIDLTRNEQGLLVRSEKSHEEAAARVRDYLQTQYLPKVREHYPDQDATSIQLMPRPATDGLGVHENLVYARWGERALTLDLYLPNREDKGLLPLVIFIHGGGWIRGSHRCYRPAAIAFAKRGFATARWNTESLEKRCSPPA